MVMESPCPRASVDPLVQPSGVLISVCQPPTERCSLRALVPRQVGQQGSRLVARGGRNPSHIKRRSTTGTRQRHTATATGTCRCLSWVMRDAIGSAHCSDVPGTCEPGRRGSAQAVVSKVEQRLDAIRALAGPNLVEGWEVHRSTLHRWFGCAPSADTQLAASWFIVDPSVETGPYALEVLLIALLGPLEVRRDGGLVTVPGGKTSELLVRLALEPGVLASASRSAH